MIIIIIYYLLGLQKSMHRPYEVAHAQMKRSNRREVAQRLCFKLIPSKQVFKRRRQLLTVGENLDYMFQLIIICSSSLVNFQQADKITDSTHTHTHTHKHT